MRPDYQFPGGPAARRVKARAVATTASSRNTLATEIEKPGGARGGLAAGFLSLPDRKIRR